MDPFVCLLGCCFEWSTHGIQWESKRPIALLEKSHIAVENLTYPWLLIPQTLYLAAGAKRQ